MNKKTGIILISRSDDQDLKNKMLETLWGTVGKENVELIEYNGDHDSLSHTLNNGINSCISRGLDYVSWIHPDMIFEQGWLEPLQGLLDLDPKIMKACSWNSRDGNPPDDTQYHPGQEQAWVMRTQDFIKFPKLMFYEGYRGIGGYEDWEQMFRIKEMGGVCVISHKSKVKHLGAQTRGRRNTTADQIFNSGIYGARTGLGGPTW